MKNYNYPFKYALMPIYRQTGWNHSVHELEREYTIVAYIAMECFVKSKLISYYESGIEKVSYQVYFEKESDFKTLRKPVGFTTEVFALFETLEEALLEEEKANQLLVRDKNQYAGYPISKLKILKDQIRECQQEIVEESRKCREAHKQKKLYL